jgi:hypothetical protein
MIRHRDVTYVEFGQEGDCNIKFSDAYGSANLFFCPCPASSPPSPPPPPSLAIEPHKSGSGSSSGTQTEIRGKYLFLQVLYLDNGNYVSPPPPFLTNYVYFMEFEFISPPYHLY